jgi:hypothetical protein
MKILVGGLWVVGVGMFVSLQGCSGGSDSPNDSMAGSGGSAAGSTAATGGSGGSAGQAQSGGTAGETGGGSAGAAAGTGGSGGLSGGGGQAGGSSAATAFVPDVPEEYVGKIVSPGMEVVAHTAREAGINKEWLMAVKNTGTAHLCAIDVSFSFLDANGAKLGSATSVPLDIPVERGNGGKGGHTNCLAPGKIGMLKDTLSLLDVDVSKIAKVTHEFGAIILSDAMPTDDIKVTDVQAVAGNISGQVFSGTLKNDAATGVKNPSVAVYGLNAVGRPLFSSEAIELVSIAAGTSWMFKTTGSFTEQFSDYAAYPHVTDL